jgi:hypothetical protein
LYTKCASSQVARFCRIEPRAPEQHRDALSFPDESTVLVNELSEGQYARVIQLPVSGREQNVSLRPQEFSEAPNETELTV